jgi:hypothetical protein
MSDQHRFMSSRQVLAYKQQIGKEANMFREEDEQIVAAYSERRDRRRKHLTPNQPTPSVTPASTRPGSAASSARSAASSRASSRATSAGAESSIDARLHVLEGMLLEERAGRQNVQQQLAMLQTMLEGHLLNKEGQADK